MKWLRPVVALGGLLALLTALALLPPFGNPAPRWAWRFFLLWCLATPYWHWLEYKLVRPGLAEHRDFAYQQTLSRAVWLGGIAVLAVFLLAGR